jgi:hypothetical protein
MPNDGCVITGEFAGGAFRDKFALQLRNLGGKFADWEWVLNMIIREKKMRCRPFIMEEIPIVRCPLSTYFSSKCKGDREFHDRGCLGLWRVRNNVELELRVWNDFAGQVWGRPFGSGRSSSRSLEEKTCKGACVWRRRIPWQVRTVVEEFVWGVRSWAKVGRYQKTRTIPRMFPLHN